MDRAGVGVFTGDEITRVFWAENPGVPVADLF